MTEAAAHCAGLVRDLAYDHYLATFFMPDDRRRQAMALYAFDAELARIPGAVSEPQLGLIRQQWWLDTLDAIYAGDHVSHPVAEEMTLAVRAARLPQDALRKMVTARESDLYADRMPDIIAAETYLGQIRSALIQLVSIVLAGDTAAKGSEAAGLAGVAFGLSIDLLAADPRLLPEGMSADELADHARMRLSEARASASSISTAALPAFLPVSLTPLYLSRQGTSRAPSRMRRQLAIWWSARRERF